MTKLFVEEFSAEGNCQKIRLIELSKEDAVKKSELLEEIAKEYEKIPGFTEGKEYVEMLKKTMIPQLFSKYDEIIGPKKTYIVMLGRYEKGQILDEVPQNAVLTT